VVVEQAIGPTLELSLATTTFHGMKGRWPNDYIELRSFTEAQLGVMLTNYDRVDFTPRPDGTVGIRAVNANQTNEMTLTAGQETRKN
jgi:hypothetical protein